MSIESKLSKIGKVLDEGVKKIGDLFSAKKCYKSKQSFSNVNFSTAILIFDSFIAFLSLFISIHLRIGMDFLDYSPSYIIKNMFVFALVSSSIFLWFQTHQAFWKYTSIEDMIPIFISVVLSNIIFFPLMMLMNQEDFLPYSVLVINIFVLTMLLFIPRFLAKMFYNRKLSRIREHSNVSQNSVEVPKVILIGNNKSVDLFLNEVVINEEINFNFEPIAILTLNPENVGRSIRGIPIVGEIRDLQKTIKELQNSGMNLRQIVITEKSIPENAKKFLAKYVQEHGLLLMHVIHQYTCNAVLE